MVLPPSGVTALRLSKYLETAGSYGEIRPGGHRTLVTTSRRRFMLHVLSSGAVPEASVKGKPGVCIELAIILFKGRRHLPVVKLKQAA